MTAPFTQGSLCLICFVHCSRQQKRLKEPVKQSFFVHHKGAHNQNQGEKRHPTKIRDEPKNKNKTPGKAQYLSRCDAVLD
jgi:hypothetical protein